jgi:branched-chain amino acid transport system substrate-binding protein
MAACGSDDDASTASTASSGSTASTAATESSESAATTAAATDETTTAAPADSSPFSLVMVVGQTGPLAGPTEGMIAGAKAAVAVLNEQGGINGRQVELEVLNDESDPTIAVSVLQQRLASGEPPDAVWAGSSGTDALAVVPELTREGILGIGQAGAGDLNNPEKFPYYFSTAPTPDSYAGFAAKYIFDQGQKTAGVIASNDATGASVGQAFQDAFTAAGGTITAAESYAPTDLDVRAQLERLKASNPDALFIRGFGAPAGYVMDGLAAIGWDVPAYGDVAVAASNLPSLVAVDALGNLQIEINAVDSAASTPSALQTSMVAAVEDVLGGPIERSLSTYSFAFDAVMQLAAGCEVAGSSDAEAVAAAMQTTPFEGVTATYEYSAESHFPAPTDRFEFVPATATIENGTYGS